MLTALKEAKPSSTWAITPFRACPRATFQAHATKVAFKLTAAAGGTQFYIRAIWFRIKARGAAWRSVSARDYTTQRAH